MTAAGADEDARRTALRHMLEARSVAVVGASVRPGSLGRSMLEELARGGFDGDVYPVNPGYDEIDGLRCYPSMDEVPVAVDLAVLGVANARIERAIADAGAAGARSVVTFSSLYEAPGDGPPLTDRVVAIADAHRMAMCGGNGMGFLNLDRKLRVTGFMTDERLRPGPITLVSHSGSAFAAFGFNDRSLGFNLLVSSGQELVTTMADYVDYALDQPSTRVVGLLLETVRDPDRMRAALGRAAARDVPVVALKMGRTAGAASLVTAHSGALAGEHGAFEALFDAYGVHECRTLAEMADTLELFASPRRATVGRGIASVHDSGGERAMFVDLAADLDVPFATLSDATIARIDDALDPGLEAANPLDAWGTGIDADAIFREAFLAMADDRDVAALAFVVDLTEQGEPYAEGYLQISLDTAAATDKPFCVLSNLHSAIAPDEAAWLRERGIPILEGTESGLRALRHLLGDAAWRARPAVVAPDPVDAAVRDRWRARLATGTPVGEAEALDLLADYGVPVVPVHPVTDAEGAAAAAAELGYPVALKTAAPGVHHKSDAGGVALHLADAAAVGAAYEILADRLGPEALVASMAAPGVEIALGIVRDPMFGPLVLVAAGGVLVELLRDRRLAIPPLDDAGARRLIDGLRVRPLLDGVRGDPAVDVVGLAHAVSRLSVLAADLGDLLDALDVNPVIVGPDGCVAVDALVELRT
ncbi:MAG TPA: acetate--CoA ligase family protein [Actinomycetota bacterium]|nr:acetate--CoA ligase family protein [Actinomycetota bacterium]